MAFIKVKGRREPIEISNERARKIKALRFGDGISESSKSDPTEMIDLGDEWAGELGQIVAIELTRDRPVVQQQTDPQADEKRWRAEMLAMPIEERAKHLGSFKMSWWFRSRMVEKEPPAAVIEYAEKLALAWFKENPNAPELDARVLEPLLVKNWGERRGREGSSGLAEKMTLSPEKKD